MEDDVYFECFNTTKNLDSPFPWFSNEKELIDTFKGIGNKPLTYNKLFIEGKEIQGFPPSKKMIEKELNEYNIRFPKDAYQIYYKEKPIEQWTISQDQLFIKKYDNESLKGGCLVCTKHNPFLEESDYMKENWCDYEVAKEKYLKEKLQEENVIGYTAYYGEHPVGIIEAFPLKLAAKLGFPVSDINLNGMMITCMNIRKEVTGNGIASKLIKEINREAKNRNYDSIEVLAFPDDFYWQPISLYKKHGYEAVQKIDHLELMKKCL